MADLSIRNVQGRIEQLGSRWVAGEPRIRFSRRHGNSFGLAVSEPERVHMMLQAQQFVNAALPPPPSHQRMAATTALRAPIAAFCDIGHCVARGSLLRPRQYLVADALDGAGARFGRTGRLVKARPPRRGFFVIISAFPTGHWEWSLGAAAGRILGGATAGRQCGAINCRTRGDGQDNGASNAVRGCYHFHVGPSCCARKRPRAGSRYSRPSSYRATPTIV